MIRLHIREERTRNGGGRRGRGRRRGGWRHRGGSSGGRRGRRRGGRRGRRRGGSRLPAAIQGSHSGSRFQLTPTIVFIPPCRPQVLSGRGEYGGELLRREGRAVSYTHLRAHETDSYLV